MDAFRCLGTDLIRVFEKITQKGAKDLDFDEFHRFAAAVCCCLRTCVRVPNSAFPRSSRALRDGLEEIWNSAIAKQPEEPLPLKIQ
jgi:hypothetical protein